MFRRRKNDDKSLIAAIREGGREEDRAITWLLSEHARRINHFVVTRNGAKEDAEDILQEGIAGLVINIRNNRFQEGSAIGTYLFAICKNIWYKRFKKIDREEKYKTEFQGLENTGGDPESEVIDNEQKSLILELFDHLKAKCREVLYLWGLRYSMKEIAEKMEYSSDQVAMNKKNLCLKELQKKMQTDETLKQIVRDLL